MTSHNNIREILKQLGRDPSKIHWSDLADCVGLEVNLFFDWYDGSTAEQTDQICLLCPVGKQCFLDGVDRKDEGVRGGFYLENGKVSKRKNEHKTPEIAAALAKKIYGEDDE